MTETAGTRSRRRVRLGRVVSDRGDKTVTVVMDFVVKHPKYGKYVRRRTRLRAHDPQNGARVGDMVQIMECRPLSKTKHWRLVQVVRRAEA